MNRWQNPDGDVRADKIFVLLLRCVSHFVKESWKIGERVHEKRCQVSGGTSEIWRLFFFLPVYAIMADLNRNQ